jgi:hypothetical protein
MNVKVQYEKSKASFEYSGKHYSGEVICSDAGSKVYWFVFDQIDVKPFGGSLEFTMKDGQLETVKKFEAYEEFILCIKTAIDKHRKELCN